MFNFTATLSYGLRLLINLAQSNDSPKQLKKIAKEEAISLAYLRKLIIPLERSGIVKGSRGPGGGFILRRKPADIPLSEVIDAISRNKVIDCAKGPSQCRRSTNCLVKGLLEEAYCKMQSVFKKKTLATILKRGPK